MGNSCFAGRQTATLLPSERSILSQPLEFEESTYKQMSAPNISDVKHLLPCDKIGELLNGSVTSALAQKRRQAKYFVNKIGRSHYVAFCREMIKNIQSKNERIGSLIEFVNIKIKPVLEEVIEIGEYVVIGLFEFFHFVASQNEQQDLVKEKGENDKIESYLIHWQQRLIKMDARIRSDIQVNNKELSNKLMVNYQKQFLLKFDLSKAQEWVKKQQEEVVGVDEAEHQASKTRSYLFQPTPWKQ